MVQEVNDKKLCDVCAKNGAPGPTVLLLDWDSWKGVKLVFEV